MNNQFPHPKWKQLPYFAEFGVFGPYAQDDDFGSRSINPMELYHNQVTRAQGSFSLRMFHRSWGIMMIQENISAPCTVLDFPLREDFARELKTQSYDIVGVSGIIVNVGKVREMCRMIRELSPQSQIVVGGHVAAIPGIEAMLDADHIVRGEGVAWMRRYLGEDETAPVQHPKIVSGMRTRIMGIRLPERKGGTAATIIPSVGCPMGCNFCTTSAFFGGKGKFVNFFESGDELFEVMSRMEDELKVQSFFVMDENFLLNRRRAMGLLERMKRGGKSWEMYVFSSANAIRKYTMEELVRLGVSWVWMGLESAALGVRQAERHGHAEADHGVAAKRHPRAGLDHRRPGAPYAREHHGRDRIRGEAGHRFPPVHALHAAARARRSASRWQGEGRLLEDTDYADIHGQYKFNWKHPHISRDESKELLDGAFRRDFERNGPEPVPPLPHARWKAGSAIEVPRPAGAGAFRARGAVAAARNTARCCGPWSTT